MDILKEISMKYKIKWIKKISSFFPNQFEGRFEDGDFFYVRAKDSLEIWKFPIPHEFSRKWYEYILEKDFDLYSLGVWDLPTDLSSWHDISVEQLMTFFEKSGIPIY